MAMGGFFRTGPFSPPAGRAMMQAGTAWRGHVRCSGIGGGHVAAWARLMAGRPAIGTRWLCVGGAVVQAVAGPLPVAAVPIGAMLVGADGGQLAVRWIGRTRLFPAELAAQPRLWPVLVAAGALAEGQPAHDMVVLAEQALHVPGHPAMAAKWLVNGASIGRPAPDVPLDVFCLELDGPGPPAGGMFAPADSAASASPDDTALLALRRHLARHAGLATGPLRGSLDVARHDRVGGWAADLAAPDRPVVVEVLVDGVLSPPFAAVLFRRDLEAAGVSDGRRGFRAPFDAPLTPSGCHLVRVRRAADGADLPGSPALLDRVEGLSGLLDRVAPDVRLAETVGVAAALLARRVADDR